MTVQEPVTRKYGWKRGLPSRRFPQLALVEYPALVPKKSLLGPLLPPIWDQGKTGSCTGHGTARAIMYARAKQKLPFIDLSRLFPYYNARVVEGDPGEDAGAAIGDIVAASQKYGDCPYTVWPTKVSAVTVKPGQVAYSEAIQHKALSVTRVMGGTEKSLEYHFKHCISVLEFPVIIGISVYESFESEQVAKTGVVPMPGNDEQMLGGHCVLAVGYDDAAKRITCQNSWGSGWGQSGNFTIPYAYVFNPDLADDFHAVLSEAS